MLQECIWGSLTLGAKQRIVRFEDEYTLNNLCCGPLLLNIIKRTVSRSSRRRTIVAIRSRLDNIDAYAAEMNGNVEMVTDFFTEHLGQLKSYGAILDNPMEILFKGLLAVSCEEFHHYIIDIEDMYYAESLAITPEELLIIVHQRYMIIKTKRATFAAQAYDTPSRKDIVQTTVPRSSHRSQSKTNIASMFTIIVAVTANICCGEQLSTQHYPAFRLNTKTVHFWRSTHQTIHHTGQSSTKEVIDAKNVDRIRSVTASEVNAAQTTTATMVTSYSGFQEGRIESEVCCLKYLRKLIMIWKHGPPRAVKDTLINPIKTPEEQLSNTMSQLWKCLISNNLHPVRPWSITTNCDDRNSKKAPPWQPQWSLLP
jgi:hypothetical protein